jgi:UDP-4-amino-4,6-dideoxy-N-acetyl-beta-L-altrosamine N-acetyltransferase
VTTCLREIAKTDLELVRHWRMLPEITSYMYTDPNLTLDDQISWFDRISVSKRDIVWIIEIDDNLPVGVLSLSEIDFINKKCAWAYYIAETAARGKGLAKPLECNIADFVFDVLNLHKLWCEVISTNDRVVALHEKFGSQVEGVLKQHVRKGEQIFDVVRMGLLREDWLVFRKSLKYQDIAIELPERFK